MAARRRKRGLRAPTVVLGLGFAIPLILALIPSARADPPLPTIEGSIQTDFVRALNFPGGATLTFTIFDTDGVTPIFGPQDRTVGPDGNYHLGSWEHQEDLVVGTYITVSDGTTSKDVTLENLQISQVNPTTDVVSGTADADEPAIAVNVFKPPFGGSSATTVANGSGVWSVNMFTDGTPSFDIDLQTGGSARIYDGEQDATVAEIGPPMIEAHLCCDQLSARGFAANSTLTFTIYDTDGVTPLDSGTKAADAAGHAFFNRPGDHDVDLFADRFVTISDGVSTKDLTIAGLSVDAIDVVENIVSGTAPDGPVNVNVGDSGGGAFGSTTASGGSWSIDFDLTTPTHDIIESTNANASVNDLDGDVTSANKGPPPPPPRIEGSIQTDFVRAQNFPGGATLTFTIFDTDGVTPIFGPEDRTADPGGHNFLGNFEHGENLVVGTLITVSDGTTSKDVTLENLTIAQVNPTADVVSGTADPGEPVIQVGTTKPPFGGSSATTFANGSGAWSVDMWTEGSPPFDVDLQTAGSARIYDGEQDATVAELGPPMIEAHLCCDNLSARGFAADSTLTFTIYDFFGGTVQDSGTKTADAAGNASFNRPGDHDLDLGSPMYVTVSDGVSTKDLTIAGLSVDAIDIAENVVSGTAPDGPVNVNVGDSGGGSFGTATASGGSWSIDFDLTSPPHDITESTGVHASVGDLDGDVTSAGFGPAPPPTVPTIHSSLTFDIVNLQQFDPGSPISLTIADAGGTLFGPQDFDPDAGGNVFTDPGELGVDIVPGLTITAVQGEVTKILETVDVSIGTVDDAADTVSGSAPSGANVRADVFVPGDDSFRDVTAQPDGSWTADFTTGPDPFDITLGTTAGASVSDPEGDTTHFDLEPARIRASLTFDHIDLSGFTTGGDVSVTISDGSGPVFGPQAFTPEDGSAFVDRETHNLDLTDEHTIVAEQGSISKTLDLVPLTITDVNVVADTVAGTAPGLASIDVFVHGSGGGAGTTVEALGDGTWLASFADPPNEFDITLGSGFNVELQDEDADVTSFDKEPPRINVTPAVDWLWGEGFAPEAELTIEVRTAPGVNPATLTDTTTTDPEGSFGWATEGAHDLVPGNEVTVSDGSSTKVHEVREVTVETVDTGTDVVTGTAPDGPVHVGADEEAEREVTASGGSWSADFSSPPAHDLTDISYVDAFSFDDDGDGTSAQKYAPRIFAELDFEGIRGEGFQPNSTVAVEIRSAPGVNPPVWSDPEFPTDGSGQFFVEPWQHNLDLVEGMEITVIGSTKVLLLVDITVDAIDPTGNVVSGTTAPGETVDLHVFGPGGDAQASALADDRGDWSATFPSYDFVGGFGGTQVGVSVADDDGDQVGLDERRPAAIEWASLTGDDVCPGGFGGPVTVEIQDATGRRLWRGGIPPGESGCVGREVHGEDLVPGLIVSATDGTITRQFTLDQITLDSVDAETSTATGTATPGADVRLSINGPFGDTGFVIVQADETTGAWTADLTPLEFGIGHVVWAVVPTDEGDGTQASRFAPEIDASLNLDTIEGCGFTPGTSVTVTIDGSSIGGVPTDGEGCFQFAASQDLQTGDAVNVTGGSISRDLTLGLLTMNVNRGTKIVTGTAEDGAEVGVGFGVVDCECGDGLQVEAVGGSWTADFSGEGPFEEMEITSSVHDEDGDGTHVSWFADLALSAASYTVPEYAGSVTITVDRFGTAHREVGVLYATSDDSATAGSDYAATSDALAFPDGTTSQTVVVPITNDSDAEGDEVFNVTLSDPADGAALFAPTTATITIEDDDNVPPSFAFSAAEYSLDENGGRATITVERTGGLGAAGVSYATSGGTATAGTDYDAASGTLSFRAGETSATFDVRINDDSEYEGGNETLNITLSNPTPAGALLGTPNTSTLTIVENESPPQLRFSRLTYPVNENRYVVPAVQRIGPLGNVITVQFSTTPGSATQGPDYQGVGGTLVFGKNETSKTFSVPIMNDALMEPAETFSVVLSSPTGASLGDPSTATVNINASDQKPDAMVGPSPSGGFIGDNVYDPSGAAQTYGTGAPRGATTVWFYRIQNDGQATNTFVIRGTQGPSKTTTSYFVGTSSSDITGPVLSGAYQVSLPPGGAIVLRAQFAVSGSAKTGSFPPLTLTATWSGDSVIQDTARAALTIT